MNLSPASQRQFAALAIIANTPAPWRAVDLPIHVESRANARGHWRAHASKHADQRLVVQLALAAPKGQLRIQAELSGLVVRVVRIAPRQLDHADNLGTSLKSVIDGVADVLGIDDRDERVTYVCDQQAGKPREYAVRVEFYLKPMEAR